MTPPHTTPTDWAALGVLALLLLTTAVGAALSARRNPRMQLVAGAVLLALALVWPVVNGPYEGPILWTPVRDHGLTLGDLLSVPGFAVAAVLLVSSRLPRISPPSVTEAARRRALARVW